MKQDARKKGLLLAAGGATLWGINGTFADMIFSRLNAPVEWVVGTRLLLAGVLILLYAGLVLKQNVFAIFMKAKDLVSLLLFSSIGMVSCQYLFFLSIGTNGAGLATILQFTSPIFIYVYLVLRKEKQVYPRELLYIAFAFVGVFLIVTKGNLGQLEVSGNGLLIGVGSALGVAFYTLQPRYILKKYGSPLVVGWGMFLGGCVFQFVQPIWQPGFTVDVKVVGYMAFIIVVGTAIAFSAFLASLNYLEPSLSNILAAIEPLVANVLTAIVLQQRWTIIQIVGIVTVLISVILFANYGEKIKRLTTTANVID